MTKTQRLKDSLSESEPQQQTMEQRLLNRKALGVSGWLLAALLLSVIFLAYNRGPEF